MPYGIPPAEGDEQISFSLPRYRRRQSDQDSFTRPIPGALIIPTDYGVQSTEKEYKIIHNPPIEPGIGRGVSGFDQIKIFPVLLKLNLRVI